MAAVAHMDEVTHTAVSPVEEWSQCGAVADPEEGAGAGQPIGLQLWTHCLHQQNQLSTSCTTGSSDLRNRPIKGEQGVLSNTSKVEVFDVLWF